MNIFMTYEDFLNEANGLLNTKKFIEPSEMIDTLNQIYHILSGNKRDYISIPNLDELIKCLKQYDKTKYSKSDL